MFECCKEPLMIPIVLVTHGALASSLLGTLKMVLGEPEGVEAFGLAPEEADDSLERRVEEKIASLDPENKGALVLVDMLGGTPFNVSMRLAGRRNIRVVTGVSLPMIFKALAVRETDENLDAAASDIQRGARDAVVTSMDFYNRLKQGS
jgi:mannose/fructose/sorbose-specific phosphotransferase system IIA component